MERPRWVGFAVRALNNQLKRRFDCQNSDKKPLGITGMQFGVISFIGDRMGLEDVFQRDIEKEFNIRRSTATGILQLMEKNGLLLRETTDYDARLKRIVLTDKAMELHREAIESIIATEEELCRGISEEEQEMFFSIIERMIRNLKQDDERPNSKNKNNPEEDFSI